MTIEASQTMTLQELRYAVTLARERHFGRAAAKCFVSQPSLSVAVKHLEDELGVALFERTKSEVVVTAIGAQILAQAEKVLDEAVRIKQIAVGGKDQLQGALKVGRHPYHSAVFVTRSRRGAARGGTRHAARY